MENDSCVRIAQTIQKDEVRAVEEFASGVSQPRMELVVFFCTSEYNLEKIALHMRNKFEGTSVVGCTTAGEIGPLGYLNHSLSGISFGSGSCVSVTGLYKDLKNFSEESASSFIQKLIQEFECKGRKMDDDNSFAFQLVDGLSMKEEQLTYVIQSKLGQVPLVGGSAGDDQNLNKTYIYYDGTFYEDSAVIFLLNTKFPVKIFKIQHFLPSDIRMVVTKADPTRRRVEEINGVSAAREYARLTGVEVDKLNSEIFATFPLVVYIAGMNFVRSIQKVNSDESLTFYCAIDSGVVLRMASGSDLISNLESCFDEVKKEIGEPLGVLGCDCILRKIEIQKNHQQNQVAEIFNRNRVVGFNSYGEQYRGIHVNQTFTGVAFGYRESGDEKEI